MAALEAHSRPVRTVAFSADGLRLASGTGGFGTNNEIMLWDLKTRRPFLGLYNITGGVVDSVVFSPDGRMLATAYTESTVNLWDVGTGQLLKAFRGTPSRSGL